MITAHQFALGFMLQPNYHGVIPSSRSKSVTFVSMKQKIHIDWKKVLLFLVVSAGLMYITRSVLMSAGVLLLLFVIDSLLANWEYRRKTRQIFKELREMHEKQEHDKPSDHEDDKA